MTGEWKDLIIQTYICSQVDLVPFIPSDVEPDLWKGKAMFSAVAFTFRNVKMYGVKAFFHQYFGELNFRCYVKSKIDGTSGVVFIKEYAAKRLIAFVANKIFGEPFYFYPISREDKELIKYSFVKDGKKEFIECMKQSQYQLPKSNSLTSFIVDRYIAFVKTKKKTSRKYTIVHKPWRVVKIKEVKVSAKIQSLIPIGMADFLQDPVSSLLIDGSKFEIYR